MIYAIYNLFIGDLPIRKFQFAVLPIRDPLCPIMSHLYHTIPAFGCGIQQHLSQQWLTDEVVVTCVATSY